MFSEVAQSEPDAIIVSGIGELYASRQLIVELVEKSSLAGDVSLAGARLGGGRRADGLWDRLRRALAAPR